MDEQVLQQSGGKLSENTKAQDTGANEQVSAKEIDNYSKALGAIDKYDEKAYVDAIFQANDVDRMKMATDENVVYALNYMVNDDNLKNECCDKLYKLALPKTLKIIISARYGVEMGSSMSNDLNMLLAGKLAGEKQNDKNAENWVEREWTLQELLRAYECFNRVPKDQLANLKAVSTTTKKTNGGCAWGDFGVMNVDACSYDANGVVYDYNKADSAAINCNNLQAGFNVCISDSQNDARVGQNMFDVNMLHELGHLVDKDRRFSKTADFRSKSGWAEYSEPLKILEFVEDHLSDTKYYPNVTESREIKILRDAAQSMIRKEMSGDFDGGFKEKAKESLLSVDDYWSYSYCDNSSSDADERLIESAASSPVFAYLYKSYQGKQPAYHEHEYFSTMNGQMIHHDYFDKKLWYAYNKDARSKKISDYQFTNPAEEFAELYSIYFNTVQRDKNNQPILKTSKAPQALADWFESMGFPNNSFPDIVAKAGGGSQEKEQAGK